MSHVDPATWTQLIIAAATLFTAIAGWLKSQSNSKKIDANTSMTADIHKVTNGPLSNMEQDVANLTTQVASHAIEARLTADAARVQAATDAQASKDHS